MRSVHLLGLVNLRRIPIGPRSSSRLAEEVLAEPLTQSRWLGEMRRSSLVLAALLSFALCALSSVVH